MHSQKTELEQLLRLPLQLMLLPQLPVRAVFFFERYNLQILKSVNKFIRQSFAHNFD